MSIPSQGAASGERPWHCGPSNTALLGELVIALPSPLLQAGTTNVFCMGWAGSW